MLFEIQKFITSLGCQSGKPIFLITDQEIGVFQSQKHNEEDRM